MDSATGKTIARLRQIVGDEHLHTTRAALACFGYDAFLETFWPSMAVAPRTATEVAAVVRCLNDSSLRFVVRGSGTGYAGGALPVNGEVVIVLHRLREVRELNVTGRYVWVEAGVLTAELQALVARAGLRYPPDPSSKAVCTIGGNIATNAGGPHCLGYGVTSNYVLEIEYVDSDGKIAYCGGKTSLGRGIDVRGALVGSEGTLGIITAARLRLVYPPIAICTIYGQFDTDPPAAAAICEIFRSGALPVALDMTCSVMHPQGKDLPFPNKAILYIEVHGDEGSVKRDTDRACTAIRLFGGVASVKSREDLMKKRFQITQQRWRGITNGTPSMRYFLFDAVVKRSDLITMLDFIKTQSEASNLLVANTFHAGDGNIHPTPFFDPRDPTSIARLGSLRDNVLEKAASLGGSLSGEHGIGIEKIHLMSKFFSADSLDLMRGLVEGFQPIRLLGQGKVLPDKSKDFAETRNLHPGIRCADTIWLNDVDNGYIIAPAASLLSEIHDSLAPTKFEFPYEEVEVRKDTVVGKLILDGQPSVRERKTGPARDLLLGGILKLRHGRSISFGSVFAKDVSAFDIRKLVFGSREALGTLEVVVLKVLPKEDVVVTGQLEVLDYTKAKLIVDILEKSMFRLSSLYLLRRNGKLSITLIIEGSGRFVKETQEKLSKIDGNFRYTSGFVREIGLFLTKDASLAWAEFGARDIGDELLDSGKDFISFSHPGLTGIGREGGHPQWTTNSMDAQASRILRALHAVA